MHTLSEIRSGSIIATRPKQMAVETELNASQSYVVFKRLVDISTAVVLTTLVLSWITPLLAILIKCSSKGPVFFIQKRVGLDGRIFNCYKFRTMRQNPEADTRDVTANDERITPIGRWLRKKHIDELPQLINVLTGDMTLVGPRPHMLHDHKIFSSVLPFYNARHIVKPGITGLAQIRGFHGPIGDYHCIYGRTRLDLFYIRNASALLDMKILFTTGINFISKDNF